MSSLPLSAPRVGDLPGRPERLAAIDVGSNSVRLVVAEWDPVRGLSIIDELKDQPRLAQGVAARGALNEAAMDRAILALGRMRDVCRSRGVSRIAAVATAAVRDAANGAEFVERVRQEVGIPLRIIDADTEARLAYRSVAHHFRLQRGRTLIADIGGGSLELIGTVDGFVEQTLSLPLGVVRLTELFLPGDREARREVTALRQGVRRQLRRALPPREWSGAMLIGSGGSFTTLARIVLARRGLPPVDSVHGVAVTAAEAEQVLEWLSSKSPDQRRSIPGLSPERADIIVAGLAVATELLEHADARELTVSAYGLREGLLLEMASAEDAPAPDRLVALRDFAERCRCDMRHVEHVRALALSLFDQLAPMLGARPEERSILEAAALLHDVGQLVSYRKHHKHSYQLLMHADGLPFPGHERALVALVSRYHRKKGPSRKHPEFAALDPERQAIVRRLSGILRVADGLDRGHTAVVSGVRVEPDATRVLVRALPRLPDADLSLELWGSSRKADVLAKVLEREVVIGE